MSYGVEVFGPDGRRVFSTAVHQGIVTAGAITIPYAGSGTYNYTYSFPEFTGRTGVAILIPSGPAAVSWAWSYPNGVPTLSVTRSPTNPSNTTQQVIAVFFQ